MHHLVGRFGHEVLRLQIDLREKRDHRIQSIRYSLERVLLESVVETVVPHPQLTNLIERLVPGSSAPASPALMTGPESSNKQVIVRE
jgi:hypothetical protein